MEPQLVDKLSRLRPRTWEQTIARYDAVEEYFAIPNAGHAEVQTCASKLGVNERTFYRLIADRRKHPAGRGRPNSRRQIKKAPRKSLRFVDPQVEAVIAEAMLTTPRPCRIADIHVTVLHLCAERCIAPPPFETVRRRFRTPRGSRVEPRPDLDRLILDTCKFDFSVGDTNGRNAPAVIVALVHPSSRTVITHEIFCGPPSAAEIGAFLSKAAPEIEGRSITVSFALRDEVSALKALLAPAGVSVLPDSYHLSGAADITGPGEALLHVFGLRIGPIAILSRSLRSATLPTAGNLEVARAVCAKLIDSYHPS
ncbi:hypothetical protein [Sphingomonas kyeonggiensis]|uniref:Uncharacterized protein n=1 Tax=Sphingomonas kyeonggiensis TaxID=1268553 RepID=A0A7W6JVU5_9SPHN|nr:hypothetical protein [Sphingomonas kyeonggiensis]MBB4100497.1 hypothetical protein [Sphingomonas kyeonggiensis]